MSRFARTLGILSLLAVLAAGVQPAAAFADDSTGSVPVVVGASHGAGLNALIAPSGDLSDHLTGSDGSVGFGWPGMGFPGTWPSTSMMSSCGCSMGMGFPSLGGFRSPWWAGMPLWAISASSGGTWPWAPWYYTPQWWVYAALMNSR